MRGKDALVGYVGRIPAPVRTKLLAAFLLVELLLVALGATGLLALREVEQRAGDLASLQHKIDAYRQMQHDTLRQLYSVSAALAAPDNATSVQRASPDQPIRLRPRPRVVCREGRSCAPRPPSRGIFPLHRHRHARAGADPRRANQRGEAGPNRRAGAARRPARTADEPARQPGRGGHGERGRRKQSHIRDVARLCRRVRPRRVPPHAHFGLRHILVDRQPGAGRSTSASIASRPETFHRRSW